MDIHPKRGVSSVFVYHRHSKRCEIVVDVDRTHCISGIWFRTFNLFSLIGMWCESTIQYQKLMATNGPWLDVTVGHTQTMTEPSTATMGDFFLLDHSRHRQTYIWTQQFDPISTKSSQTSGLAHNIKRKSSSHHNNIFFSIFVKLSSIVSKFITELERITV